MQSWRRWHGRPGAADRARAILLSANGWAGGEIARAFGVAPDSVRRWRNRLVCAGFMAEGVAGLRANPQAGPAPIKGEAALTLAREVLSGPVADRPNWTLPRLQAELAARSDMTTSKAQLSKSLEKGGSDGAALVIACTGGRTRKRSTGLG